MRATRGGCFWEQQFTGSTRYSLLLPVAVNIYETCVSPSAVYVLLGLVRFVFHLLAAAGLQNGDECLGAPLGDLKNDTLRLAVRIVSGYWQSQQRAIT